MNAVAPEIAAGRPLAPEVYRRVRMRTIFECHKWDPQSEDVEVLAPFPLELSAQAWAGLARDAEALAAEALAAEREIAARPELIRELGMPRKVRRALSLAAGGEPSAEGPRFMRFDFHPTAEGWRISEVNSDVPGGFVESCGFARLVAEHAPGRRPAGDPAGALVAALAERGARSVGLVHATAYTDDRQVMVYLSDRLAERGIGSTLAAPDGVVWRDGRAHESGGAPDATGAEWDAIVRFFPAEWLPNLPRRSGWGHFFAGSRTPQSNPPAALLAQSKRFPLVWERLRTELPTWRRLLPETVDPRDGRWRREPGAWVLKPALGRVGEAVGVVGATAEKELRKIRRWARWFPRMWAAQRRFGSLPLVVEGESASAMHACIGVYVVDGRAAGAYGRISPRPLIDGSARDAAVLVRHAETEWCAGGGVCAGGAARRVHGRAAAV